MKIYVASSWRNNYQPDIVKKLREDGHQVYDFKDSEGFGWSEVDPDWKDWPGDIDKYLIGLCHHAANRGFNRDMNALINCDACLYVMPCGPSASMELGYAVGTKKLTIVYIPELREPDLMVKMADIVSKDFDHIRALLIQHDTLKDK